MSYDEMQLHCCIDVFNYMYCRTLMVGVAVSIIAHLVQ